MDEILSLIQVNSEANEFGDCISTERRREVFCEIRSVGMKEFYQSQAVGLRPEIKAVLADYYDYDGEELAEYDGIRYRILRTYRKGIQLELTLTRGVIDDVCT